MGATVPFDFAQGTALWQIQELVSLQALSEEIVMQQSNLVYFERNRQNILDPAQFDQSNCGSDRHREILPGLLIDAEIYRS